MVEYIEREAAIEAFDDPAVERNYGDVDPESVIRVIERIPAADVRPVGKCKWENLVRCGFASVEATCSACGKTLMYKSWWHFCPNCGAQVEREQEEK